MDFTLNTYRRLLNALIAQGYRFQPFADFLENPADKAIILRHDVDMRPEHSLRFAKIQQERGVRGSYYFRMVPQSYDEEIIRQIASLGHEIGYHYETMDTCKGDVARALDEFCRNLELLRKLAPVKTICMHGSPLSKWDNRDLWEQEDMGKPETRTSLLAPRNTSHYRDFGIIGEPYFDLDFNEVLYLTDTGRRWDGDKVSVRDKVAGPHPLSPPLLEERGTGGEVVTGKGGRGVKVVRFRSTSDIIAAAHAGLLPDRIMLTFHPQRWTDKPLPWLQELMMQNIKNVAKRILIRIGQRA